MLLQEHADTLEGLYRRLNRRRYVHPDPLEFLYGYDCPRDREVVALLASSLAYGRVAQILKSVSAVLAKLGTRPARYLARAEPSRLRRAMRGFRHRFATGEHVSALLVGAGRLLGRHGSLEGCFRLGLGDEDETVLPALQAFAARLAGAAGAPCGHLLADPARGSACKRLNLMLRWLVRRDRVDPGGWEAISAARLIVPLDTHMHRISLALGATARKSADARAAAEVTRAFRGICPDDPVRYDFALTRLGIRDDMELTAFLDRLPGRAEGQVHA